MGNAFEFVEVGIHTLRNLLWSVPLLSGSVLLFALGSFIIMLIDWR